MNELEAKYRKWQKNRDDSNAKDNQVRVMAEFRQNEDARKVFKALGLDLYVTDTFVYCRNLTIGSYAVKIVDQKFRIFVESYLKPDSELEISMLSDLHWVDDELKRGIEAACDYRHIECKNYRNVKSELKRVLKKS